MRWGCPVGLASLRVIALCLTGQQRRLSDFDHARARLEFVPIRLIGRVLIKDLKRKWPTHGRGDETLTIRSTTAENFELPVQVSRAGVQRLRFGTLSIV
jgi:hypothetical protein